MPFYSAQHTQPTTYLVPYASATPRQRALALYYLRQRLSRHFPTLSEAPWAEALDLFQPDLQVIDEAVTLSYQDLTELVQHLATTPELPQLDPPIYGSQAICLAQQRLALEELAARAVAELASIPVASRPWLTELLSRLVRGSGMAQQVVQAVRWGVGVGRPLPAGLPGLGPTPVAPK